MCLLQSCASPKVDLSDIQKACETAEKGSELIRLGSQRGGLFRAKAAAQLATLHHVIMEKQAQNQEEFIASFEKMLEAELKAIETIKALPGTPIQVQLTKMHLYIEKIKSWLGHKSFVDFICGNTTTIPSFIDLSTSGIHIAPGTFVSLKKESAYANGDAGALAFSLWISAHVKGKANEALKAIKDGILVHWTPTPEDFDTKGCESSLIVTHNKKIFLLNFNNGYVLGAQRRETDPYDMGAQDCSSFVTEIIFKKLGLAIDPAKAPTTLWFFMQYLKETKRSPIPGVSLDMDALKAAMKEDGAHMLSLDGIVRPVCFNSLPDLKPGTIIIWRTFSKLDDKDASDLDKLLRGGGHIGFFLGTVGKPSDGLVAVLDANRDLENVGMEGLSIVEIRDMPQNPRKSGDRGVYALEVTGHTETASK